MRAAMKARRLKSALSFLLMVAASLCALNILFAGRHAVNNGSGDRKRAVTVPDTATRAAAPFDSYTAGGVTGAPLGWDWEAAGDADDSMPACAHAAHLFGRLDVDAVRELNVTEAELAAAYPRVAALAQWAPHNCTARSRIAFVVPFKERQAHLARLLHFLIPVLQRQLIDFRFIVVEQWGDDLFNKGRLLNAAFTLAQLMPIDCVVFHDVDMLPQYDTHSYHCPRNGLPIHHGAYVDVLDYRLYYDYLVGGVTAFTLDQYRLVNGHSNSYWGYGGEDDDMGLRIMKTFGRVERPPRNATYYYSMLGHGKRRHSSYAEVRRLVKSAKGRMATDGLAQSPWHVVHVARRPMYYHMLIDVGQSPDVWWGVVDAGVNVTGNTNGTA